MKDFRRISYVTLALEILAVIFMLLPASEPVSDVLFFTVIMTLLCTIVTIGLDFLPETHRRLSDSIHKQNNVKEE